MEKSLKSISANYGVIMGTTLALITVIAYVFALELFTKWWLLFLILIIVVVFGTMAAVKSKKMLGGYISFKNAFTSYFIAILIGTLISTIVGIVIFNFIDPEAANVVKEMTLDSSQQMMESFGAPQADIDKAMAEAAKTDSFSLASQAQRYVFGLVFYCVIGLIVALAVRKNDPNAVA